MNPKDKVYVVTGGGDGMGRALVVQLLQMGARVAAVDLSPERLEATRKLVPAPSQSQLSLHVLDVSNQAAAEALPSAVLEAHGAVDVLVNNAGIIQPFVKVQALDYGKIKQVMDVNFYGTLYLTKAFLPYLMQRPAAQIANVSSMGGFLPVPGQSIYGASKAAVKLLTEALYAELLGTNVKVSIIFPGAIGTNITQNSGVRTPGADSSAAKKSNFKPLPVDQAAQIILSGLQKEKPRIFVGNDARFLDVLYRIHPTFATRFIAKQMAALLG